RLGRGGLSLALVAARPFESLFLWHDGPPMISQIGSNARLTGISAYRRILTLMSILLKILIVAAVVGTLRSLRWFRDMSQDLDEAAYASIRKIMGASEECGSPPETIPLLMILTALMFTLSMAFTKLYVH